MLMDDNEVQVEFVSASLIRKHALDLAVELGGTPSQIIEVAELFAGFLAKKEAPHD